MTRKMNNPDHNTAPPNFGPAADADVGFREDRNRRADADSAVRTGSDSELRGTNKPPGASDSDPNPPVSPPFAVGSAEKRDSEAATKAVRDPTGEDSPDIPAMSVEQRDKDQATRNLAGGDPVPGNTKNVRGKDMAGKPLTADTDKNSVRLNGIASTEGLIPGMQVFGENIPVGVTLVRVDSKNSVIMSEGATETQRGVEVTFN